MRQLFYEQHRRNRHSRRTFYRRDYDLQSYQVSQAWRHIIRARRQRSRIKQCVLKMERKVDLNHEKWIRRVMPTRSWEVAKPGTVNRYAGALSQRISSLSNIAESEIDEVLDEIRERE